MLKSKTKKKAVISALVLNIMITLLLSGCASGNIPGTQADGADFSDLPDISEEDMDIITQSGITEDEVVAERQVQPLFEGKSGNKYAFKTDENYICIYDGNEFKPTYLNGVNIGSGYPGYFPGELAIDKKTYLRWFEMIAGMNCNTVRIYTTMMPDFYDAFYEYNNTHDDKLYLIMGVWYDEDKVLETSDAFDVLDYAIDEAKEQIDIIHGDCKIEKRPGRAYGSYDKDVSDYVLGWILGIESDALFVGTTNDLYPDLKSYEGEYFYTEDSDAFHVFLTKLCDGTVKYESEKYHMQRPVSIANWPTADEMDHPEEPLFEREDAVSINIEHIKPKDDFEAGLFASYHVYPYYPDFMVLTDRYINHKDREGDINTYEAYLQELKALHTMPVMVAEFGVPSSRGCTHVNPFSHYDQGHMNEKEQGEALSDMAKDIFENGYCGGIVFTWQDEWFKRTWNTMDYTDPDRRPFWSDIQTSEQNYGLLAFDPGRKRDKVILDGDFEEWENDTPVCASENCELYVNQDERYMYFCVKGDKLLPDTNRIIIPLDITPESGSDEYNGIKFDKGVDFVIDLNGKDSGHVYVHSYYDRYAFAFGKFDDLFEAVDPGDKDSKKFVPIYLNLNREQVYPMTGETKHAEHMETGELRYGITDPDSEIFDSLADFVYGDGFVEVRIPWGLLSFRDPSTKEVEADFWKNGYLDGEKIEGINVGVAVDDELTSMQFYTWDDWDAPIFHERLKKSYDILKERFGKLRLDK